MLAPEAGFGYKVQDMSRQTSNCPICKRRVKRDAPDFPFCSEHCRFVDLGRWFGEEYRVRRQTWKDTEKKNA